MWNAVTDRDKAADGLFFYSVATTGVYCRPSCASRPAKRVNVRFHASCAEAEAEGFRACKRCRPNALPVEQEQAQKIAEACRSIEVSDDVPKLDELARRAHLSPFHFHRVFKSVTGVTPKAYAVAHRRANVRRTLESSHTVTGAIHDAGYNASSRFYATSNDALGMTPTAFRNGGSATDIRFAVGECSLGAILVAQSPIGVCAILMGDDPNALIRDLEDRFPRARLIGADKKFEAVVAAVVGVIEEPSTALALPLDIRGTAFQQRVWEALRRIPPGATVSYTDIAKKIKKPKAVRAVAGACAANALAVVIPCHRVVRNDGDLSGYRWGIERKRTLLAREAKPKRAKI